MTQALCQARSAYCGRQLTRPAAYWRGWRTGDLHERILVLVCISSVLPACQLAGWVERVMVQLQHRSSSGSSQLGTVF